MEKSFDDVFESELDPLHRYLSRRVGPAEADDLAAETFAIAYRRWDEFVPGRAVRPWLYGIAANLVRHQWRKERRMLRAYARTTVDAFLEETELSASRLDAQGRTSAVAAALAELRPAEREVLLLHAWGELTDSEIASALSLPLGTVKSRLSRARDRMRNRLGASGKEEVESKVDVNPLTTLEEMSR